MRSQAIVRRVAACLVAGALAMVALAGCAQAPVPRELLTAAETAVARARLAAAGSDQPAALTRAGAKLQAAHMAARAQAHEHARSLAEQALVDAELAEAEAQAAQAQEAVRRLREPADQQRRGLASVGDGA